jgi:hypothetical protein
MTRSQLRLPAIRYQYLDCDGVPTGYMVHDRIWASCDIPCYCVWLDASVAVDHQ